MPNRLFSSKEKSMRLNTTIVLLRFLFALICINSPGSAGAQGYPVRDIHIINGYAAGAGADVASRIFGKHLEETFGHPVIIENRPGAFTNLAAAAVGRAQSD